MPEHGGATTQDGIYYQNTVAARHLADLLDLGLLLPRERVVEVRVEAPSDVDDIVVRFSDGHREWLQAKSRVQPSGHAWNSLWADLAAQSASPEFGADDRLVIVLGELDHTARRLRDVCERSIGASDDVEWRDRLGNDRRKLLSAIERALGSSTDPWNSFGGQQWRSPPSQRSNVASSGGAWGLLSRSLPVFCLFSET